MPLPPPERFRCFLPNCARRMRTARSRQSSAPSCQEAQQQLGAPVQPVCCLVVVKPPKGQDRTLGGPGPVLSAVRSTRTMITAIICLLLTPFRTTTRLASSSRYCLMRPLYGPTSLVGALLAAPKRPQDAWRSLDDCGKRETFLRGLHDYQHSGLRLLTWQ